MTADAFAFSLNGRAVGVADHIGSLDARTAGVIGVGAGVGIPQLVRAIMVPVFEDIICCEQRRPAISLQSNSRMELRVESVRFVEERQPSMIEAVVLDSAGCRHSSADKVAIFTADRLDANSKYSHPGVIRCEVMSRSQDTQGREVVRVTTEKPDAAESREGTSEFVVFGTQLS